MSVVVDVLHLVVVLLLRLVLLGPVFVSRLAGLFVGPLRRAGRQREHGHAGDHRRGEDPLQGFRLDQELHFEPPAGSCGRGRSKALAVPAPEPEPVPARAESAGSPVPTRRGWPVVAAGLLLILAGGCGGDSPPAGTPPKADPVAGLSADARSADLLRGWLDGVYAPGRAGVRRAAVEYRTVRDADFYREPIVREGTVEFTAGDPLPAWNPADAAAVLARWLDPEAFRKDYAAAAFAAREVPGGGTRVEVSGDPATNVRAFLFAPDGTLAGEEVLVHLDRAPRPRAERHPVMTTLDGRTLIAGWTARFEAPDVGPSTSDVSIAWVSHGDFAVPGAYCFEVRGGGSSWSVTIQFSRWRLNDEVDG